MSKDSSLTPSEVLAVLRDEKTEYSGGSSGPLDLPWDLSPADFLEIADADLEAGSDERALVNALSNANRALHCQVDSILYALGLHDITRSMRFPLRLELLSKLGIVTRKALQRLNASRNLTEHEYAIPGESEVRLFSDVVALFIEATNRYIGEYTWDFHGPRSLTMEIAPDSGKAWFNPRRSDIAEIAASHPDYVEIVSLALQKVDL